jgi:hypothetical protein
MRQTDVEVNFIKAFEDKEPKELQLNDNLHGFSVSQKNEFLFFSCHQ